MDWGLLPSMPSRISRVFAGNRRATGINLFYGMRHTYVRSEQRRPYTPLCYISYTFSCATPSTHACKQRKRTVMHERNYAKASFSLVCVKSAAIACDTDLQSHAIVHRTRTYVHSIPHLYTHVPTELCIHINSRL